MSFKYEVQVIGDRGQAVPAEGAHWYGNGVVFATREEADAAGRAKYCEAQSYTDTSDAWHLLTAAQELLQKMSR